MSKKFRLTGLHVYFSFKSLVSILLDHAPFIDSYDVATKKKAQRIFP